jgi:hypothetical protein
MKTKSMTLFLCSLSVLSLGSLPQPISASSGSATFLYLAGSEGVEGPDIARADNGDTIEVAGSGFLSIHPNSVSGGGTFIIKDPLGTPIDSGNWTAEKLNSFVPYDSLAQFGAPNVFGGKAVIQVALSNGFTAILTVDCAIFSPPGHTEGVTVNIQSGLNFNKEIFGTTLFIKQ